MTQDLGKKPYTSSLRKFSRTGSISFYVCLVGCVSYLVLFICWRIFQAQGIIFYQGLTLAIVVASTQLLVHKRLLPSNGQIKDAVITFLICYSFMFTIPTTVDRAYSVNFIIELQQHPDGLSHSQITALFANNFSAQGGVEKRLVEQTATGSLVEREGRYYLTTLGQFLATSFCLTRRVFNTQTAQQCINR